MYWCISTYTEYLTNSDIDLCLSKQRNMYILLSNRKLWTLVIMTVKNTEFQNMCNIIMDFLFFTLFKKSSNDKQFSLVLPSSMNWLHHKLQMLATLEIFKFKDLDWSIGICVELLGILMRLWLFEESFFILMYSWYLRSKTASLLISVSCSLALSSSMLVLNCLLCCSLNSLA